MQPLPKDIDALQAFNSFVITILSDLKVELRTYLAKVADVSDEIDPVEWWSRASPELSNFQSSSASAERVFSLLSCSFNHQQDHALEDYIKASLMLQFNDHYVTHIYMLVCSKELKICCYQ